MTSTSVTPCLIYQTHWDREWYESFWTYQIRLAEVVDGVLDALDTGTLYYFHLDGQTSLVEDYTVLRPERRNQLEALIQVGRISVGPWFVMPDEFLVSGESLIRNLQVGIRSSKRWGCTDFTGYLPDTFGHSSDIPLLLRGFGIDSAIVWRGVHLDEGDTFVWKSRNGSEVLGYHLKQGYFQNLWHDAELTPGERQPQWDSLLKCLQENASSSQMLVPLGGDHLGPLPNATIEQLRQAGFEETLPPAFMSRQRAETQDKVLPTLTGELLDNRDAFVLHGVWSSRLYLKQANRRLEHRLTRVTEPLLAWNRLLSNDDYRYPDTELAEAWKLLLLNHPHDSICGCSIDSVHRENEVRYDSVTAIAEALECRSQAVFTETLATPNQWLVYNLGDIPYSGVVRVREWSLTGEPTALTQVEQVKTILEDGYRTDHQAVPLSHKTITERWGWIYAEAPIPANGYRILSKQSSTAGVKPITVSEDGLNLHSDQLAVTIDSSGQLSVQVLATGQQYLGLHRLTDTPEQGDSYTLAPVPDATTETATFMGAEVVQTGPLVARVALTYRLSTVAGVIRTIITLTAGQSRLDFETTFTNAAPNHRLQVQFETSSPITTVEAESHFGLEARTYDPNYRITDAMPAAPQKELVPNTGPIQRFVLMNGQMILTEGLTEYEVAGNELGITLLRGFDQLSKPNSGVRAAQAGPPFETPEGQCLQRKLVCHYAWRPAPATVADAYAEAAHFMGVVWGEQGRFKESQCDLTSQSLIEWDNPHMVSQSLYWQNDTQMLVIRLLNTTNQAQTVSWTTAFAPYKMHRLNFLDDILETLSQAKLTVNAYDVVTIGLEIR